MNSAAGLEDDDRQSVRASNSLAEADGEPDHEDSPAVQAALQALVASGLLSETGLSERVTPIPRRDVDALLELRAPDTGRLVMQGGCVVRLDNLPGINGIYGMIAGDLAVETVVGIVATLCSPWRSHGAVCTAAGARFVLLLPTGDPDTLEALCSAIEAAAAATLLDPNGMAIRLRVSVAGTELAGGSWSLDDLLVLLDERHAPDPMALPDHEPLSSLALGRRVRNARARAQRVGRIAQAFEEDRIEAYFQPVIDIATGQVADVEALARVREGDRVLAAGEFIDELLALGSVVELDERMLELVATAGPYLHTVTPRLFVNVSPISLGNPDFREGLRRLVEHTRDDGLDLVVVFELTEQAVVRHIDTVRQLHDELGITFAIDDFGTGYSSLRTVTDLAICGALTYLKIDGSLVRQLATSVEAYKVVLGIASLGRSLGLRVIAEHVSDAEILARLRTTGVRLAQGHHLSPPLSLDQLRTRFAGRAAEVEETFHPSQLRMLEPYLGKAFGAFYDNLMADEHFAAFFESREQIAHLVERQRLSFLASLTDSPEALERRCTFLGKLHADIGIPFTVYMKGVDLLNDELLEVLAHVSHDGMLLLRTQGFFRQLRHRMAWGYLTVLLANEAETLRNALAGLDSGRHGELRRALLACRQSYVSGIAARSSDQLEDDEECCPAYRLLAVEEARDRLDGAVFVARALHRRVHSNTRHIRFFLDRDESARVVALHLEARAHFWEAMAVLGSADAAAVKAA